MNFFKRGIISIVRRPGKTAILLTLIFVLSNIIAGAISVKNALVNTEDAILDKMGVEVTIQYDWDAIYNNPVGEVVVPSITAEMVEKIGQSEYIKYYDYSINQHFEARDVKNYYSDYSYEGNGWFSLTGGQSTTLRDAENGDITIKEGRIYTQEEIDSGKPVLLISDKVAQLNALNVGSTVTFLYTLYDYSDIIVYKERAAVDGDIGILPVPIEPKIIKTFEFEFKIIGIFTAKPVLYTDRDGKVIEQDSPLINTVYTVNRAINACVGEIQQEMQAAGMSDGGAYTDATSAFVLKHPDDVELFESQNKQYLPEGLIFVNNAKSFDSIRTPMANVEWISEIVMWVAVGATILIISLLVTLFLRDRRHEMGIYLALGARRGTIATQILTEVLIIALIAVSLSVFTGNLLASNMSATMLENQLAEEQKSQAQDGDYGYRVAIDVYPGGGYENNEDRISTEEVMGLYKVSLDAKTVLFIYLVGMGSVLVSTLVPIIYTLRLRPRQILM